MAAKPKRPAAMTAADKAAWKSLRETGLDYHCTVRCTNGVKGYFTLRELATSHLKVGAKS